MEKTLKFEEAFEILEKEWLDPFCYYVYYLLHIFYYLLHILLLATFFTVIPFVLL